MIYVYTIIIPIFVFFSLLMVYTSLSKKKFNCKTLLIILLSLLGCIMFLGFLTFPSKGDDLYRHYIEIDTMHRKGLSYVLHDAKYKDLIIINFLFYFISQSNNYNLLPVIATFVMYSGFIYIIYTYNKKDKPMGSTIALFIAIHFSLCFLRLSISGIRNFMAFSIISVAIYRDLYLNKKNIITIIFYLLPLGIHSSTILIILFRVCYFFIQNIPHFIKYFFLVFNFMLPHLVNIISGLNITHLNKYLSTYYYYEDIQHLNFNSYVPKLLLIITMYIIYIILNRNSNDNGNNKYKKFVDMITLFTISFVGNSVLFNRLVVVLSFIYLPLIDEKSKSKKNDYNILFSFLLFLFIMWLLAFQLYDFYNNWNFLEL